VEGTDGWGPWVSEKGLANGRTSLTEGVHRAVREKARVREGIDMTGRPYRAARERKREESTG
jgi:hypothetical protein